jgi:hypothetical protein
MNQANLQQDAWPLREVRRRAPGSTAVEHGSYREARICLTSRALPVLVSGFLIGPCRPGNWMWLTLSRARTGNGIPVES